jgi:hypothetical protein
MTILRKNLRLGFATKVRFPLTYQHAWPVTRDLDWLTRIPSMMRQMIPLVLLGTALVPDWATAIGKRCTPQYPVYWTPTCPQPVVILPPCLPSYEIIPQQVAPQLAPPTVTPETAKPEPAKPEPAKPDPVAPPKSPMPGIPRTSAEPPVIERVAAPVPAVPEAKPVIIPVTAITVPETKANTPEAPG